MGGNPISFTVSRKRYIYIAGPMQGYKDFNFPAFKRVEAKLRGIFPNSTIFNPATRDEDIHGADVAKSETGDIKEAEAKGFNLRDALKADLSWIAEYATAIVMLEGWENSKGARAEHALAVALGLDIWYEAGVCFSAPSSSIETDEYEVIFRRKQ